jgi:hypothetical protein
MNAATFDVSGRPVSTITRISPELAARGTSTLIEVGVELVGVASAPWNCTVFSDGTALKLSPPRTMVFPATAAGGDTEFKARAGGEPVVNAKTPGLARGFVSLSSIPVVSSIS